MGKVEQYAAILDLADVTPTNIKNAYRRQMLIWHPDRHYGKETAALAHTKAQAINEAYEFLSEIVEELIIPTVSSPTVMTFDQYQIRHTYQKRTFTPGFPDASVFEVFVKSTNIVSVGYNKIKRTLYLKFQDGSIYRYLDIPSFIFDELLCAESHGKYANNHIYHSYIYERC